MAKSRSFFTGIPTIAYEGPGAANALAFRHYNPDEVVMGKRMEDHLRFAVCFWHTFCWPGSDVFGAGTFSRPWLQGPMDAKNAKAKREAALVFVEKLDLPFYCFHDVDVMADAAGTLVTVAVSSTTIAAAAVLGFAKALGYDAGSEAVRRSAIESAVHTGNPTLTEEVNEPSELVARQRSLERTVGQLAGRAGELLEPGELRQHAIGGELATLEVGCCRLLHCQVSLQLRTLHRKPHADRAGRVSRVERLAAIPLGW